MSRPTTADAHQAFLSPLERPRNVFVRLVYLVTRRRFGRTPAVFTVAYARAPWIALAAVAIALVIERFLRIGSELRLLLQLSIAMRRGCAFCEDLARAECAMRRIGSARFRELLDAQRSSAFSPREKAALAYAASLEAAPRVDRALLTTLRDHFDEREVVEIIWVCAVEHYYSLITLPLGISSDNL
jgi:alkylhydroperoxidase family enzyme